MRPCNETTIRTLLHRHTLAARAPESFDVDASEAAILAAIRAEQATAEVVTTQLLDLRHHLFTLAELLENGGWESIEGEAPHNRYQDGYRAACRAFAQRLRLYLEATPCSDHSSPR